MVELADITIRGYSHIGNVNRPRGNGVFILARSIVVSDFDRDSPLFPIIDGCLLLF